jgi:hypothetical protein
MEWKKLVKLISAIKTNNIEFLCKKDDYGIIPEPYPAKKLMPEWFKALPMKTSGGLTSSTIKRCNPFLDSMSLGWIIPLAADVEFSTNEDASGVNYKWNFYKTMIENHSVRQISSEKSPNPVDPKPPMKFMNYWAIKVPKDYSVLFVPPLNRPDPRFTCFSGMVDCDGYFEYVNFPFVFNKPNFHGIIPAGTPLVQAIPIKRSSLDIKPVIRPFNKKDDDDLSFTRKKRASHESHYRDNIWSKKP